MNNLNWFILHWKQWTGTWVGSHFIGNWKTYANGFCIYRWCFAFVSACERVSLAVMHFSMLTINFPVLSWCQNHLNAIATMRDSFGCVWVEWLSMYCTHRSITKPYRDEYDVGDFLLVQSNAEKLQFSSSFFFFLEQSSPCLKSERFESQWTTYRPIHAHIYLTNILRFMRKREKEQFSKIFPFHLYFWLTSNRLTVTVWWCSLFFIFFGNFI